MYQFRHRDHMGCSGTSAPVTAFIAHSSWIPSSSHVDSFISLSPVFHPEIFLYFLEFKCPSCVGYDINAPTNSWKISCYIVFRHYLEFLHRGWQTQQTDSQTLTFSFSYTSLLDNFRRLSGVLYMPGSNFSLLFGWLCQPVCVSSHCVAIVLLLAGCGLFLSTQCHPLALSNSSSLKLLRHSYPWALWNPCELDLVRLWTPCLPLATLIVFVVSCWSASLILSLCTALFVFVLAHLCFVSN